MIAIVGSGTKGNVGLVEGLARLGLDVELVGGEQAGRLPAGSTAVDRLDVLPTLDGVEAGLLELLRLERRGHVRVVNTVRALLNAHDKLRTRDLLAAAGIPHPRTLHVRSPDELRAVDPPVVVKPRFGSWGRDVVRCRDRGELERWAVEASSRPWFRRHGALAQELLPPAGSDLRLIVAGGKVVGAAERSAAPGEWRTNVSLGGSCRPVAAPDEAVALALLAARAAGAEFVGVDLLPSPELGWVVLELNGSIDFDGGYSLAGHDVYADLVEALGLARGIAVPGRA